MKPTSGRTITSNVQSTLAPVDALEPMIETIAQMSSARMTSPVIPAYPPVFTIAFLLFTFCLNHPPARGFRQPSPHVGRSKRRPQGPRIRASRDATFLQNR